MQLLVRRPLCKGRRADHIVRRLCGTATARYGCARHGCARLVLVRRHWEAGTQRCRGRASEVHASEEPFQKAQWDTLCSPPTRQRTDSYAGCTRRDLGDRGRFPKTNLRKKALKRPVGFGKSLVSRGVVGEGTEHFQQRHVDDFVGKGG